ncbi:MAG: DUF3570 domain-containing protein [Colwellia sp.]|nr:DUF3570 domain-containing protein [Colwellia sp.]MCW8865716.1 DUF3570 domain-containing protein [Colwellia sp.]MCW9080238.1 DUF3570 domain-containing protein [Colwellia sp.]
MMRNKADNKNIKAALTIATAALLGGNSTVSAETVNSTDDSAWEFDSAFLFYSEADRVSASEAIFNAKKTFEDDEVLNLKLTVDALTGASANGAVAQPNVQTFTRPSGNGQYDVAPGDTPLDDTFRDTRVQINGQWTQTVADDLTASGGVHLSKEYDYLSLGINGNLAIDFDRKNTTFSLGFSYFQDTFTPEGGIPKPFASMLIGDSSDPGWDEEFAKTRIGSEDDKTTTDILLGITQVINRRMIMQFNYSYSMVDGYLTDPFKIMTVVDNDGLAQDYVYESRPDSRVKQSFYAQSLYHFDTTVLDVSYRYMWDDWEITSHTIDSRFRIPLSDSFGTESYLQPHFRFYQQGAADFYRPFMMENDPKPAFASADYRIGEMTAYTLGIKYGRLINNGHELSFRLEYYRQTPTDAGFDEPGVLKEVELYPSIDAIIAQVTYSF